MIPGQAPANVRSTPESEHSEAQERVGLKKQTLDVCLPPDSGRKWLWHWMSAFDPKATLAQVGHHTGFTSRSAGFGGIFLVASVMARESSRDQICRRLPGGERPGGGDT